MRIHKSYACSVSRSLTLNSMNDVRRMEQIANDLIKRIGDEEKYIYYVYTHEYYPGNCVFELDIHMHWSTSANKSNSPEVYISLRDCDCEAEILMNQIVRSYSEVKG